ncbi:MAG: TfoX/Sxy family protein [candidate division WOR-3 bacterium]|nr:TfoX/Sxy family protein [candidate division WOR-3 bacterium]
MKWKKTSEALNLFLKKKLENADCQARMMFGCPSYFINNNMFIGAFQKNIFIRLAPADTDKTLKKSPNTKRFEPRPGRVMKEYASLPESIYKKKDVFKKLLKKSIRYTRSLPPKKKRSKR